ncbi:MAG: sigma-70 family RNA polymerase sigma factor, partial [Gammaproteobacteria bacterium]|nr:sigma-70 family RNA polymerase sigma factor [Gammaproteobacteria bacterium]
MSGDEECTRDDLLTRALAGERAAFAGLVRRQQRAVYSLALRMLSDRHAAEDLAQEVFLQLYRNLTAVSSESHLTFWLRKVTMHRAIDRLRREP